MATHTLSNNTALAHPKVQLVEQFYNKFNQRDISLIELTNDAFE